MENKLSKSSLYGEYTRLDHLASRAEQALSPRSTLTALEFVNNAMDIIKSETCRTKLEEDIEILIAAKERREKCLSVILGKFPELNELGE